MFGLYVLNESGSLQLSADDQYLSEHEGGSFSFGAGVYSRSYTFSTPVESQYPPLVFARVSSASAGGKVSIVASVSGSPGAWTGFVMSQGNTTQSTTGLWFAATYQPSISAEDYGFNIYSESGNLIFDLNRPILKFSRFVTSWTYAGNPSRGVYSYSSALTLAADEYIMINQFIRSHVSASSSTVSRFGVSILPNSLIGLTVNTGGSGPFTSFGYFALPLAKRSF